MATQTDPELHSKPEGFKSLSEAPSKRTASQGTHYHAKGIELVALDLGLL